jgi:hypothetical protein
MDDTAIKKQEDYPEGPDLADREWVTMNLKITLFGAGVPS